MFSAVKAIVFKAIDTCTWIPPWTVLCSAQEAGSSGSGRRCLHSSRTWEISFLLLVLSIYNIEEHGIFWCWKGRKENVINLAERPWLVIGDPFEGPWYGERGEDEEQETNHGIACNVIIIIVIIMVRAVLQFITFTSAQSYCSMAEQVQLENSPLF